MMNYDAVIEGFVLGVMNGFGPCIASCAPIIVPMITTATKNWKQGIAATLIFNGGRIISTAALCMIAGMVGQTLDQFFDLPFYPIIGTFILLMAVFLFFDFHTKCIVPKIRVKSNHMLFIAGILMGFTPCGPLGAALVLAAATQSAFLGLLVGIVFAIGTSISPLLIIGGISGAWAKKIVNNPDFAKVNKYVCSVFLVIIAITYFLR